MRMNTEIYHLESGSNGDRDPLPLVVISLGLSFIPQQRFENTELGESAFLGSHHKKSLGVHGVRPTSPVIPRGRGEIDKKLPLLNG